MRIVFMGTPVFAVPVLDALVAAEHDVVAVYTQPPRRAGRGKALTPSPVQARAEALRIPVHSPTTLRDAMAQATIAALDADVAVVAAYGLILPRAVLDATRHGCLNVHASLLPRWRGAAPIQRAILAGDAETGVGIMQMEAGLDTGPVRAEARTEVDCKTAGELTDELAAMGAALMVEVLAHLDAYPPVPQPTEGITHAPKVDKAETRLDFSRSANEVERQVRAFHPLAYFESKGERIRVLKAELFPGEGRGPVSGQPQLDPGLHRGTVLDDSLTIQCATGTIRPTLVQRAGRGVMTTAELLRGFPIPAGTQL
jgi:methionyl-tRNA formyltransferase